jgi:hypothetical protein
METRQQIAKIFSVLFVFSVADSLFLDIIL